MKVRVLTSARSAIPALALIASSLAAQTPNPDYQTRQSQCRHEAPPGTPLTARRTDSGITTRGYSAQQVLTWTADAGGLRGGELLICTEYGRVEIEDSEDSQVRMQVRIEGFGEGSASPEQGARRVIEETTIHGSITSSAGRLMVRFWHSTLGFTTPGSQPAFVSVRLMVPATGSYAVRTEAFHGAVAVRRLTLERAVLRGNVGYKMRGIPGFVGETELDNVILAGDVDIDNLIGIPGIRAPVPASMAALASPIRITASAASTSTISVVNGGSIMIAVQPAPDLGVRAIGESNDGRVTVGIDGGVPGDSTPTRQFRVHRSAASIGFGDKPVQVSIRASSGPGAVHITSIPNAPLRRP
jgi:hypothetical protein